ncbi:hypothetical protein RFI_15251 [Reticulomyxa filosa]|uniref:Uncharacterized protein n=1 Tax=Reticulomyxa filosa TaxID=46433 RepID=X6N7S7_RETFI|nr:hypothetical protein RFI_15251 [Reticulomyxa filosa]|eukprot:ETO21953.1 hypothetical protein RFI_15251 [Reticulomyxa filosa]
MDIDLQSSPVGFLERYVFSESRTDLLKELVQGSEEYYKYKLLDISARIEAEISQKNEKKKESVVEEMKALHQELCENVKMKNNGELKNLMLRNEMHYLHSANGEANTEELWKEEEEEISKKKGDLNSSKVDGNVFRKEKLEQAMDTFNKTNGAVISTYLSKEGVVEWLCTPDRLKPIIEEIQNKNALDKTKQRKYRQLLGDILDEPFCVYNTYWPDLIELDLSTKDHNNAVVTFGTRTGHRLLTFSQMNDLLLASPQLMDDAAFIMAYFAKSLPMQCMKYYQSGIIFSTPVPESVLEQFHSCVTTFLEKHLTQPHHSTFCAILLMYLLTCQFNRNVTLYKNTYIRIYVHICIHAHICTYLYVY